MYIRIIYGVVRSFFYFSHIGMDVYRNIRVIREDKGLEFGVKNLIKKKYNTDYKYNKEIKEIKSYLLGIHKDC